MNIRNKHFEAAVDLIAGLKNTTSEWEELAWSSIVKSTFKPVTSYLTTNYKMSDHEAQEAYFGALNHFYVQKKWLDNYNLKKFPSIQQFASYSITCFLNHIRDQYRYNKTKKKRERKYVQDDNLNNYENEVMQYRSEKSRKSKIARALQDGIIAVDDIEPMFYSIICKMDLSIYEAMLIRHRIYSTTKTFSDIEKIIQEELYFKNNLPNANSLRKQWSRLFEKIENEIEILIDKIKL